jgi:hypothetical protein
VSRLELKHESSLDHIIPMAMNKLKKCSGGRCERFKSIIIEIRICEVHSDNSVIGYLDTSLKCEGITSEDAPGKAWRSTGLSSDLIPPVLNAFMNEVKFCEIERFVARWGTSLEGLNGWQ